MCREAMDRGNISPEEIISMGITNQRNTQCVWDRKTGKPLLRGIVWQDTGTRKLMDEMRKLECIKVHEVKHCGRRYVVNSSPVLLRWIMDHHPDIAKKMIEGVAFGLADVMDVVAVQTGIEIKELKIDGGAPRNNLLAQSFADFVRCKVVRPQKSSQLTGAGAAQLAAIGAGVYTLSDLPEIETETEELYPVMDEVTAKKRLL